MLSEIDNKISVIDRELGKNIDLVKRKKIEAIKVKKEKLDRTVNTHDHNDEFFIDFIVF